MKRRMTVNLAQGTPIVLQWFTVAAGQTDATTGSVLGESTPHTETVKGFFHAIEAKSVVRQFAEIETGDAILELPPETVLEGRKGLRFYVNGAWWGQKEVSDKLSQSWDTVIGETRFERVVLVCKSN